MECLGVGPGVAGWKAHTNPLSYVQQPLQYYCYKSFMIIAYSSIAVIL